MIFSSKTHLNWAILTTFFFLNLISCTGVKYFYFVSNRDITKEIKKSALLSTHFTGFALYDPESKSYLCNYNDHLQFTPASNTKILTAFACLQKLRRLDRFFSVR